MVLAFSVVRENTPPWAAGTAIGVTNGFVVGSGAIFQPLLGWLLDLRWDGTLVAGARIYTPENFEFAFLVLPVIGVIGILCALATRETHGQPLVEEA
jgi:MFS family permease